MILSICGILLFEPVLSDFVTPTQLLIFRKFDLKIEFVPLKKIVRRNMDIEQKTNQLPLKYFLATESISELTRCLSADFLRELDCVTNWQEELVSKDQHILNQ